MRMATLSTTTAPAAATAASYTGAVPYHWGSRQATRGVFTMVLSTITSFSHLLTYLYITTKLASSETLGK